MNAVITGASKGIGKAIADQLFSKGINISICSRNMDDLIDLKQELISNYTHHPKIHLFQADVSKKDQVLSYADDIKAQLGTVDILINNAGIFIPGSLEDEEDGALEAMIDTNLYSAYHLTRALLPEMKAAGSGHIFNMCSVASIKAYPNGGSYAISKFALLGFSKCLREELKPTNIKVTSILPGATWSNSWAGVELPEDRLMQASDIAEIVWSALSMSPSAVMEEIIIRPQLGDL
jgi:short-subunit dehydrogenase